jgi:hypothetical protein
MYKSNLNLGTGRRRVVNFGRETFLSLPGNPSAGSETLYRPSCKREATLAVFGAEIAGDPFQHVWRGYACNV